MYKRQGLAEEGFVEGENVVFDVQNAQADTAISAQIADVMAGKYDMICAIAVSYTHLDVYKRQVYGGDYSAFG